MPDPLHFDAHAEVYERARPPYPETLWARLGELGLLRPGTRVVELGAGTGQATGPMLRAGALVTSVEPGAALVDRLRTRWPAATVHVGTAESVLLPAAAFDLAVGRVLGHRTPQNSCRTSKIKRARRWPGGDQGCTGDIDSTGSNTPPQLSPTTERLDQ